MTISSLEVTDSDALYHIEQQAHAHPWSLPTIQSCFGGLYHNIGLYEGDELKGFAIVHQVIDEATLMDICVFPSCQGKGYGKQLLQQALEQAKQRGVTIMMLEVRASNTAAIALYNKLGFNETYRRNGYYPTDSGREDAIMMELALS
ncbi:ribosomal-protein-alanine N-acetyltransferase [Parashewanella curva]|uniref:[Ribosomal protein bS18]-alanine N-acetyltransferase n=1 Tax=Parashewanella curva TaxID=2338552 RepID=A0A3L8PWK5_9GAMM|nr:ribosomal protein S18-alanine N-acetyltransferase [Parashewanella curva]RLV59179.1 ribosomal-protein-alanine N-acetyltransferase [Parashewanella curva]